MRHLMMLLATDALPTPDGSVLSLIGSLGSAAAAVVTVWLFLRSQASRDEMLLNRIEAMEKMGRETFASVCSQFEKAVRDQDERTQRGMVQMTERLGELGRAIQELRVELGRKVDQDDRQHRQDRQDRKDRE